MAQPTRAAQIVNYLPTLYYQDPMLRRVIDAIAGRLAEAQFDAQQVMHAHWVDTADDAPLGSIQRLADLPRIAALVPLAPFPDEETAQQTPETVLVDEATVITGPGDAPLTVDQLLAGQRLFIGGARQPDEAVLATRISVGRPLPLDTFEVTLTGRLFQVTPATAVDPLGKLVLLTGRSGVEMFHQRLTLTVEAFLEGAGTAPAILKMVAATMGWGPLQDTFAVWSDGWTSTEPVFEALAEGAPAPIRLREMPLRSATTPIPHRVRAGARWTETNDSPLVIQPTVQFDALDRPVVIPTLVNLDAQVAIATLVTLETVRFEGGERVEQGVTLRIEGQPDGMLRGTLIERRLPGGEVTPTDVTDRIRVRTGGLRVDREGASAFLRGGTDERAASLVISDGQRVIRLTARGEGTWGNGIRVAYVDGTSVELTYDPALAAHRAPSPEDQVYEEARTLVDLVAGDSPLVTARDLTFTIPEGESHWVYFDHMGEATFDVTRWDYTVFDEPPAGKENPDARYSHYPAKGIFDYCDFDNGVFFREFLRAYRFDDPDTVFDTALFSRMPEQVEVLLEWQEGQRATVRIDVPIASQRERQRLAFLPGMTRKVKAAGIKVVLASRFLETQPLGERPPVVWWRRTREVQPLGEALRLRIGVDDAQALGDRVICVCDSNHWDASHFETRRG